MFNRLIIQFTACFYLFYLQNKIHDNMEWYRNLWMMWTQEEKILDSKWNFNTKIAEITIKGEIKWIEWRTEA